MVLIKTDTRSEFADMQGAELEWWRNYLGHPTSRHRMLALYGARYLPFFWEIFRTTMTCIEFGSGPLPVLTITNAQRAACVDTLAEDYEKAGLLEDQLAEAMRPTYLAGDVGGYDTALVLNVLDHTTDPKQLLNDAYQCLRPHGRLCLYVHLHEGDRAGHVPVKEGDVFRMVAEEGFENVRFKIAESNVYDPPAVLLLAEKPDVRDEALADVLDALGAAGVSHMAACGTALGAHRDLDFIAWDHDIDLMVPADQFEQAKRWLGDRFELLIEYPGEAAYNVRGVPVDIFALTIDGERAWHQVVTRDGPIRYEYEASIFEEVATLVIRGCYVLAPKRIDDYLEATYGPDWRVPKQSWDFASDPPCLKR